MQNGDFTHIEIPADEPDRARSFYTDVFGWSFGPETPGFEGYHLFTTPVGEEGMGGAIGKRGESAPEEVRAYVNVDSVDDTLARITARGGATVQAKTEVPGLGYYATFTDTEGNTLALWERAAGR